MNMKLLFFSCLFIGSSALSMQSLWPKYKGITITLNNGVEVPMTPMMAITQELDEFRKSDYQKFRELVNQVRADKLEMAKAHEAIKCEDSPENWPKLKFLINNIVISAVKEKDAKLMLFDPTISDKDIRPTFLEEAEVPSSN